MVRKLESARVETIHRRGGVTLGAAPGGLYIADVEHTALIVNVAARPVDKVVGGVMSVGGVETMEQPLLHVSLVVAVGILEINKIRRAGNDDATVPKLKAGRIGHLGKRDHLIGHAITVFIR